MKIAVVLLCLASSAQNHYVDRMRMIAETYGVGVVATDAMNERYAAVYDPNQGLIFVRRSEDYWLKHEKIASDPKRRINYSTKSRDHVIRHEVGHALLHRAVGTAEWNRLIASKAGLPDERIKHEVGDYATASAAEFVSEVYAGILDGKEYPEDVMDEYRRIWGMRRVADVVKGRQ